MKTSEFNKKICQVPFYVAIFRVVRPVKWFERQIIQKGDEVAYIGRAVYVFRTGARPILSNEEMDGVEPAQLEFVEYRNCPGLEVYSR
jgi:hypothetical protein